MRFVSVEKLKTALTGFTFVTGPPVRLITIGTKPFAPNSILVATVAARNDESYHAVETKCPQLRPTLLGGYYKSVLGNFIWLQPLFAM